MTEVRADSRLNSTGTEVRSRKVETVKEEEEGEFCRSDAITLSTGGPLPMGRGNASSFDGPVIADVGVRKL